VFYMAHPTTLIAQIILQRMSVPENTPSKRNRQRKVHDQMK
jgi:hypothetical protein